MAINCIIKPFIWDLNNGPAILLKGVPPDFAMIWFDRHEVLVVLIILLYDAVGRYVGLSEPRGTREPSHPQILKIELTLSQPGGRLFSTH